MGASLPLLGRLLGTAPRVLLWTGIGCGLVSLWIFSRLLGRTFDRVRGRTARPIGLLGALLSLVCSLGLGAVAAVALGLCVGLAGYRAFTARTHVAEIQCEEVLPSKLRLSYVSVDPEGRRGRAETYDLEGDEWSVGGEIVRFVPQLTALGVTPVFKVTRVEGRWRSAADANAHRPTVHERGGGAGLAWLWMERHGTRGPLGWAIAGVHGQAVSQLPDKKAIYDVYVTPNGYVVDKR